MVAFTHFRMTIQACRSSSATGVQLGGVRFRSDGSEVTFRGAMVDNIDGSNADGEGPGRAIDGLTTTKWRDANKKALTISFASARADEFSWADEFSFITAFDSPEEDPMRWTMEGSADGQKWTPLIKETHYEPPEGRNTPTKWFALKADNAEDWTISKWLLSMGTHDVIAQIIGASVDGTEEQLEYVKKLGAHDHTGFLNILQNIDFQEKFAKHLFEGAQELRTAKAATALEAARQIKHPVDVLKLLGQDFKDFEGKNMYVLNDWDLLKKELDSMGRSNWFANSKQMCGEVVKVTKVNLHFGFADCKLPEAACGTIPLALLVPQDGTLKEATQTLPPGSGRQACMRLLAARFLQTNFEKDQNLRFCIQTVLNQLTGGRLEFLTYLVDQGEHKISAALPKGVVHEEFSMDATCSECRFTPKECKNTGVSALTVKAMFGLDAEGFWKLGLKEKGSQHGSPFQLGEDVVIKYGEGSFYEGTVTMLGAQVTLTLSSGSRYEVDGVSGEGDGGYYKTFAIEWA